MIAGSYVNFAICEYYNDNIFTVLSQMIFTSVASCEANELFVYDKVTRRVFMVS